ncbi:MAG: zinc-dependent dehydrogenase [Lachnospiraceae bacterium]|nr:zinc-dependent dehydrogenase [Lachnospiraceae bacterium]MCD8363350.1 zinc-dependent dehydrogenase [Lachnospiraceae bacterium]
MNMRAVVLEGPNKFHAVSDYPKPEITDGEMLLKMERAAICGTDIRILEGKKTKDVRYPSVIGHEMCGTIVEIADGVEGFAIGDKVAIANVIPCGCCPMCRMGRENVCMNRQAIGYEFDGGFAEYVRIPQVAIRSGNVVKLPEHVTFAEGAVIEPLSCCLRGQRNAGVKFNDNVLIVGAGPIGLMHVMLAKAAGARRVIVSELNEYRRGKALECGADIVVDSTKEDLEQIVMRETKGIGMDVIIMAIGVPSLVTPTIKLARKGGAVSLFAGFTKGVMADLDPNIIHYNELIVTGSSAYKRQDYLDASEMVINGYLDLKPIITHTYKIEDFQAAYEMNKSGAGLKIEIEP